MTEVWRDATGYEGVYQVSNFGRVKSLARVSDGGYRIRTRIMKLSLDPVNNRFKVNLRRRLVPRRESVCRLVLSAFEPHAKAHTKVVSHKDGDTANNRLENLYWSNGRPGRSTGYCRRGHVYDPSWICCKVCLREANQRRYLDRRARIVVGASA